MNSEVAEVIKTFERLELSDAIKYVSSNAAVAQAVSSSLNSQLVKANFYQPLFEWLYKCVQLEPGAQDLYCFCLQFTPQLVVFYLHAVYEDLTQQKANAEALLIALLLKAERDKSQAATSMQVPTLAKSSIYHQSPSQFSQLLLTEAVLQRHNEVEIIPKQQGFAANTITVNNRLHFLMSILDAFCDNIMSFSTDARTTFCHSCIRLVLQGMKVLGSELAAFSDCLPENCILMKRFSVSDSFITSLLRGVRICLFQSCHVLAFQALRALRLRAEYELLTNSIQVSHTLIRLTENVKPREFGLDILKHSSYHGAGNPEFTSSPADIHVSLNSHILHHSLSGNHQTISGKSTTV